MSNMAETVGAYVKHAVAHRAATEVGNSEQANAEYDGLMRALRLLLDHGARSELLELLDHEDPSVRCWAATHLLPDYPQRAIPVLRDISQGASFVAFDAAMVLSEWEKGTLKVP